MTLVTTVIQSPLPNWAGYGVCTRTRVEQIIALGHHRQQALGALLVVVVDMTLPKNCESPAFEAVAQSFGAGGTPIPEELPWQETARAVRGGSAGRRPIDQIRRPRTGRETETSSFDQENEKVPGL